jgi:hypothetical protein
MARGDKTAYTGKQKRQARHIEKGYQARGLSRKEAVRLAWATVNRITGGGKKSGSGRGRHLDKAPIPTVGPLRHPHRGSPHRGSAFARNVTRTRANIATHTEPHASAAQSFKYR